MNDNRNSINAENTEKQNGSLRFFSALLKNRLFILLFTLLFTLLGAGYAALIRDTVYTAENEVIFAINIVEYDDEGVGYVSATNNLNYAGRYISTVQQHISTPKYVNEANNIYSHAGNEGAIDGKAIKMNYGDDTLIFSISYSDISPDAAEKKLEAVIESAKLILPEYVPATEVKLMPVQNRADITEDNGIFKFTLLGFAAGLVLSVGLVFLRYSLDNTVKSKEDFELITDTHLLACINNDTCSNKKSK